MRPQRSARLPARLVVALGLMLAPSALAHVPLVDANAREIDASGSWAFFETLAPGQVDAWTFEMRAGERIFLLVAVPLGDAWRPDAALAGPRGPLRLEPLERVGYEMATPYAAREVWTLDAPAPETGRYTLTIGGEGGRYVLGIGLNERFSLFEWATIPLAALRIHQWQGQPAWLPLIPYAIALLGAALLSRRAGEGFAAPHAAAALYAGSALDRVMQLAIALAQGASPEGFGLAYTGVTIAAPLALSLGVWRARRPLTLLVLATLGVLSWAGLLIGPAIAATGAFATGRRRTSTSRAP